MKTISVFGTALALEFRGKLDHATVTENVALSPRTNAIQPAEAGKPCKVGWTLKSSGGPRGLYVFYASMHETPCELVVNGQVVQRQALFESTFTHKRPDWRYQVTCDLKPGENTISIQSASGLPHIFVVAVADPPPCPQPSVDDYFDLLARERATPKASFKVRPSEFAGLIKAARRFVGDDASGETLARVAGLAVAAARADTADGQMSIPYSGPLNGQRVRQLMVDRLMRLGVDAIVETGTYRGSSAAFFARRGLPVHTCELMEENFAFALGQLTAFDNVDLHLQDSRAFLSELAADRALDYRLPLFYLDAHWYDDLPLADELNIIRARWENYVVVVDDFQVPEADYNFDRYDNGLELTLDYLDKSGVDLSGLAILFPTAAASAETGAQRGTLILAPEALYQQSLRGERSFYRYTRPLTGG